MWEFIDPSEIREIGFMALRMGGGLALFLLGEWTLFQKRDSPAHPWQQALPLQGRWLLCLAAGLGALFALSPCMFLILCAVAAFSRGLWQRQRTWAVAGQAAVLAMILSLPALGRADTSEEISGKHADLISAFLLWFFAASITSLHVLQPLRKPADQRWTEWASRKVGPLVYIGAALLWLTMIGDLLVGSLMYGH